MPAGRPARPGERPRGRGHRAHARGRHPRRRRGRGVVLDRAAPRAGRSLRGRVDDVASTSAPTATERGTITLWLLGLCLMLFALGGISLDLWRSFSERRALAATADAAALAGASAIDEDRLPPVRRASCWSRRKPKRGRGRASLDQLDRGRVARRRRAARSTDAVTVVVRGRVEFTLLGLLHTADVDVVVTATATPRRSREARRCASRAASRCSWRGRRRDARAPRTAQTGWWRARPRLRARVGRRPRGRHVPRWRAPGACAVDRVAVHLGTRDTTPRYCVVFAGALAAGDRHARHAPSERLGERQPDRRVRAARRPAERVAARRPRAAPSRRARVVGPLVWDLGVADRTGRGDLVIVPWCATPGSAAALGRRRPRRRSGSRRRCRGGRSAPARRARASWPGIARLATFFWSDARPPTTASVSLRGFDVDVVVAHPIAYALVVRRRHHAGRRATRRPRSCRTPRRGDFAVTLYVVWEAHAHIVVLAMGRRPRRHRPRHGHAPRVPGRITWPRSGPCSAPRPPGGSVAASLGAATRVPDGVGGGRMFSTIVVGTDGSDSAFAAVVAAAELVGTIGDGATLHIVSVQKPVSTSAMAAGEMAASGAGRGRAAVGGRSPRRPRASARGDRAPGRAPGRHRRDPRPLRQPGRGAVRHGRPPRRRPHRGRQPGDAGRAALPRQRAEHGVAPRALQRAHRRHAS